MVHNGVSPGLAEAGTYLDRECSVPESTTKIQQLEERLGANWQHLTAARELAIVKRAELRTALARFDSEDTSIVVSGSLAREEFTEGSDIDWTLLIDGFADHRHFDVATMIRSAMKKFSAKDTGGEDVCGVMVFSHDLVHQIGGENDTNSNTTLRLLLLLESCCIGRDEAYRRVVRDILDRYLLEDRGFWDKSRNRVPRFLQNDFARFWRTMAVDFAYKRRKRSGSGWAIRSIKLRMSRKLIYVSGLLACFRCHLDYSAADWESISADKDRQTVVTYMEGVFQETPLEIVAGALMRFEHLNDAAQDILGSYNEFLGILANQEVRDHLDGLPENAAETDEVYRRARNLSHRFRDGLSTLFFDEASGMNHLTKTYGVF